MLSPFSPGTKAKNYGSSGCPGSYPTVQSLNSRYLSSALFLLPCFRLSFSSIQPNAIFSFLTSYMSPWCFSIPSISSVLGLSTPPPAPSTPWGLPTFSSCLCHGGSCCWAEYWWGHNIWKIWLQSPALPLTTCVTLAVRKCHQILLSFFVFFFTTYY